MEMIVKEMQLAEKVEAATNDAAFSELADLQLSLIGGGSGVEIFG